VIDSILKKVNKRHLLLRLVVFAICCFFIAFTYNLFMVKNQLVMGGMSGLAIIFNHLFGMSIPLFLNISTVILVIFSYFMLDWKKTAMTLAGGLFYNYMVALSAPLAQNIDLHINNQFLMILTASVCYGIFSGILYRTGWNTGGSDTVLAIMKEKLKMPMGLAGIWFNIFIVLFGLIVFGPTNTLCAVFILILNNKITDFVTLGVKDSKMCFVKSKKNDEIQDYIIKHRKLGVTAMASKGGIFTNSQEVLLVIVPSDEYYGFKHMIKRIDQASFVLTADCYAVSGGHKKQLIPF